MHESHGPAQAFGREAGEKDIVFKDEDSFGAGGKTGAEAGHVGLEDAQLAVGGMLVDAGDFDEIAEPDALELGPRGFASVGAVYEGNAINTVESTPILCQRMFVGGILDRGSGCGVRGSGGHG